MAFRVEWRTRLAGDAVLKAIADELRITATAAVPPALSQDRYGVLGGEVNGQDFVVRCSQLGPYGRTITLRGSVTGAAEGGAVVEGRCGTFSSTTGWSLLILAVVGSALAIGGVRFGVAIVGITAIAGALELASDVRVSRDSDPVPRYMAEWLRTVIVNHEDRSHVAA